MTPFWTRFFVSLGLSSGPLILTGYSIMQWTGSIYYLFLVWFLGFAFFTFVAYFYYSFLGAIIWGVSIGFYGEANALTLNVLLLLLGVVYFPVTYGYAYHSLRQPVYHGSTSRFTAQDVEDYMRNMGWSPDNEKEEPKEKVITKVVERVKEVPRKLDKGEFVRIINYWQQKFNEAPEGSRERQEANKRIREYQDELQRRKERR